MLVQPSSWIYFSEKHTSGNLSAKKRKNCMIQTFSIFSTKSQKITVLKWASTSHFSKHLDNDVKDQYEVDSADRYFQIWEIGWCQKTRSFPRTSQPNNACSERRSQPLMSGQPIWLPQLSSCHKKFSHQIGNEFAYTCHTQCATLSGINERWEIFLHSSFA